MSSGTRSIHMSIAAGPLPVSSYKVFAFILLNTVIDICYRHKWAEYRRLKMYPGSQNVLARSFLETESSLLPTNQITRTRAVPELMATALPSKQFSIDKVKVYAKHIYKRPAFVYLIA